MVALTYGSDSEWVRNVIAHDGCELDTQGQSLTLDSPYLYRDEKRRAMPGLVRFILGLSNVSDFLELAVAGSAWANHGEESKRFENKKSA